jgi:nucleoside-diphosphate-sugar epimerase
MRVFVAGASGAIGIRLLPQLVDRGHEVIASTHTSSKSDLLRSFGVTAVVMNGLDAASVGEAVARAEPEVLVHEMTGLAGFSDLRHFDEGFARTNALRTRGTDYLLAAAEAVGVRRFVAQSFTGWPNERVGEAVKTEEDPLDADPPAHQRRSIEAIRYLERAVLETAPIEGLALRYGNLHGPGTSIPHDYAEPIRKRKLPVVGAGAGVWSFVHVDDAATATAIAVERGAGGLYNIVDDEPAPVAQWLPYLAECLGAPPPRRVPTWLARFAIGEVGISMMTQVRGSSNAKAKRELGWEPRWPSWREGFRLGLAEQPARKAA